jgi:hypothetical protein
MIPSGSELRSRGTPRMPIERTGVHNHPLRAHRRSPSGAATDSTGAGSLAPTRSLWTAPRLS